MERTFARGGRGVLLAALLALVPAAACEGDGDGGEEAVPVMPGKEDDYLSPTSREYRLWGLGDLALEASWADRTGEEREAHVREMLEYRFKAYAHFINVYFTDKTSHDANAAYGGFSGQVRSTPAEWVLEPLDDTGLSWTFLWELVMGGPRDLMDRLPLQVAPDGGRYVMVKMPRLTEAQLEAASYPSTFDPATWSGEVEEVQVMVSPEAESKDAWPEYARLFEDGVLDVLIVVGGDYNAERYDLKAAKEIFAWLKRAGYKSPVASFEALALDSPAFERTLPVAPGRTVKVQVTLLHPDVVDDGRLDALLEAVRQGFRTRDVVIYDGHAGTDPAYSGVVVHYNPRRAITANELAGLDLPEDRYQLFLFNGCKTYGAYPDALYRNPRKTTKTMDIVSTVNFSWLTMQPFTTSGFLNELLRTSGGRHDPRTFTEILAAINQGANHNVYYGVHGLDDNPHLNPWADVAGLCTPCSGDGDCGGSGNRCVRYAWGRACAAECTDDDGCPGDYRCQSVAVGSAISGRQCLPATLACE